ncbi:BRO1-domain-containing protein, partial [Clavulina sp. PMI_390]
IAIPRKKTDEVDWTSPIRSIISHSYGESPDSYAAECAALQRCRQDAVKGAGSDMTARDLLYKYFGQLELLELRFSEIKVTFPWYDAFTSKLTTQTSLAYEKASIIFQMAATHSAVASTQNRSDPEGLKRSFHYFKTSAGMLTYINDNFLHAPSTDLSRDVVKLLVGIMLAQATEVFFEKLIDEKKSQPAFNAKVAAQASFLYNGLVEEVKEFYGKNIFDRNWVTLLQIKAKYFSALMQYQQYLADTAKAKYGDALARISLAESLSKDANKLAISFNSYFIPSVTPEIPADGGTAIMTLTKTLMTLTAEKKAEAQRENDLIYNAVPVPEATLPAVDKLVVANPITIQEVYASAEVQKVIGPDMFGKLIPLSVHKSASIYSEEKAKLVRAEVEKAEDADVALASGLESLGLPAGLQKWKDLVAGEDRAGSGALPRELEVWADEIEAKGGLGGVDGMLNQLGAPRAAVTEELAAVGRDLDNESRECERMRIKYEHEWTQDPSAPKTRAIRQELKSLSDSLAAATSTDEQVVKLWNGVRPDIALLLSGPDNLERFFKDQEQAQGGAAPAASLLDLGDDLKTGDDAVLAELGASVAAIDEALGKLNKIKRERGEVLKDLKEKIQNDDVSHLLLVNHRGANAEQAVFTTELEKFRPYQARVTATVTSQDATLDEVSRVWKSLKGGKGKSWVRKAEALEKRRGNLIGRFVQAKEIWGQVREGVGKGLEFYRQLGKLVKELRTHVDEYVKPRNAERERLASELESRKRITSPSAPSPARPPAPPSSATPYDLSGSLSSMSISSPPAPPQPSVNSWESASAPPRPPAPPSTSVYSALPPPPPIPHQSSYTQAPPSTNPIPSPYGLPPPPPPPSQYSSPPPLSSPPPQDPYASLFSSLPPPPPPPPSLSQSYYPSPPQQQPQYGAYPPPPPQVPQQQQQQPAYYQSQPYPQQYGGYQQPPQAGYPAPPPPQQQGGQQPPYGYVHPTQQLQQGRPSQGWGS